MFKSKKTMQQHKRKQSQISRPTSAFQATARPSFPTHMQTAGQAIDNNQPSSAFQATARPSFPTHTQTAAGQAIDNTNHPSSTFLATTRPSFPSSSLQASVRPSFIYNMRQNSSSSSSSLQASVRPSNVHHNSSSSASSSHSQSLQSQPTIQEPVLHQSSSTNSLLNDDQDLRDEYELNLLSEVEIIDGDGNILRIQKMSVKEVYKLNEGEKVLVHVNAEYQLIGNAGGLCSRFMTLLLKEPNLCPPDAKDWKECKERCGVMLIVELRRRFNIPQSDNVDKVLCAMYRVKRRTLKYRLKMSLYKQAANKLNEVNGLNELGAQEINYSEDDLLEALDLLEPPENFRDHQWQVYKSHLRKPIAKKQSACGKKARHDQMHSHTTGAVSFARRNHEFKVNNKRSPNDVERFQICYKTADDTYIQEATTEMMAQANREILRKKLEVGGPEGNVEHDVVAEIARNVLNTLIGDENPRCFGAGVTKSQVSKFSRDLRKMRGEVLTNENRFLLEKVQTQKKQLETQKKQLENQNKEIETHKKQLENQGLQLKDMGQKLNELYGMLKVVETAFPDLYNGASTSAASTGAASTGTCDKQPSFGASPITDHYSPIMDHQTV